MSRASQETGTVAGTPASEQLPDGGVRLIRGVDTRLGEAGHCDHCGADMLDGPDACIGMLPGVVEACCGHGDTTRAYVTLANRTVLYGVDALRYMGRPTWP